MKNTVASKQNVEQNSNNNTGNLNMSGLMNAENPNRNNTPKDTRKSSNRGQSAKERVRSPKNTKGKKIGDIHASTNFMMRSQDMKNAITTHSSKSNAAMGVRKQSVDPVSGNPYNNGQLVKGSTSSAKGGSNNF
jgi:hypothetical protein